MIRQTSSLYTKSTGMKDEPCTVYSRIFKIRFSKSKQTVLRAPESFLWSDKSFWKVLIKIFIFSKNIFWWPLPLPPPIGGIGYGAVPKNIDPMRLPASPPKFWGH